MARRWLCQVLGTEAQGPVYLRRESPYAGLPGHSDDEPCELPVTIPYATRFKTKREAAALAEERGLTNIKIMRTWA